MAAVVLNQNYQRFYLNENNEEIANMLNENFNIYNFGKKYYENTREYAPPSFKSSKNKNKDFQNSKMNEDKKQSQSSSDGSDENHEIHSESDKSFSDEEI